MGLFDGLLRRNKIVLPCKKIDSCPYEYDKESERDIEGMPFIKKDIRSCPKYGHICPEYMEELGLTIDDLNIRSTIHCGGLLDTLVQQGTITKGSPQYTFLKPRYDEIIKKYPRDKFPQYY